MVTRAVRGGGENSELPIIQERALMAFYQTKEVHWISNC
jgi:hypothetical protein